VGKLTVVLLVAALLLGFLWFSGQGLLPGQDAASIKGIVHFTDGTQADLAVYWSPPGSTGAKRISSIQIIASIKVDYSGTATSWVVYGSLGLSVGYPGREIEADAPCGESYKKNFNVVPTTPPAPGVWVQVADHTWTESDLERCLLQELPTLEGRAFDAWFWFGSELKVTIMFDTGEALDKTPTWNYPSSPFVSIQLAHSTDKNPQINLVAVNVGYDVKPFGG